METGIEDYVSQFGTGTGKSESVLVVMYVLSVCSIFSRSGDHEFIGSANITLKEICLERLTH